MSCTFLLITCACSSVPECTCMPIYLYHFIHVCVRADGEVDAVTFGTGTGGTLSGLYTIYVTRLSQCPWCSLHVIHVHVDLCLLHPIFLLDNQVYTCTYSLPLQIVT